MIAETRCLSLVRLLRAGEIEKASRALHPEPANAEDWRAAGIFNAWRHDWQSSQTAFQRALDFEEPNAEWWCDVGLALIGSGAAEEALNALEKSLALEESARALVHMGEAFEILSRDEDSYARFKRAAKLEPDCADAVEGLVRAACKLGWDEEALQHAKRAARLRRFDARSLQVVADMQFYSAQLESCLRTYRRALRADPDSPGIYSAYLFATIHDPRQTPQSLREVHKDWFRRHPAKRDGFEFRGTPHKKPRVGYFSIEFRSSPTEYFLLPLLETHDRQEFEIYCYNFSRRTDSVTERYEQAASCWRDISAAGEDEILRTIREDEIDVLVDTSGHFAPRMQPVFARRAAPVQVLLPIYPASTGCPKIDYVISDRWTTPDSESETQYVEQVCRLASGYIVYAPPPNAPPVNGLPAAENGYVTFGLFQRPAKFNSALWLAIARILEQTPQSRLLVHHGTRDLDDPEKFMRRTIRSTFAQHGIASERIEFAGRRELREHLETVARCDIALDTFPYSGHTTTGDALWMGVPVVTLAGHTHASRVSTGFLSRLGLEDWVADSLDDYVGLAASKARDPEALAALRAGLRRRMSESSICKARLVTRELEAAYRQMIERIRAL